MPQLMPAGLEVTVPTPAPALVAVSVVRVKLAVTLRAALMVTEQALLVPEQSPDQPVKTEDASAAAVRVTEVWDRMRCQLLHEFFRQWCGHAESDRCCLLGFRAMDRCVFGHCADLRRGA